MTEAAEVGSTANRYQILAKLAVGGMAEIFLARGEGVAGVERYCVLKRIQRDRAGDAQFVRMFLDEARLAAQLQHPNIASTYDIGMLGGAYFFTMEYVHGETLWAVLERAAALARPLPLACVLTVVAGTAAGLHHAHERRSHDGRPLGIVHRDLSPSNVMVNFEGIVKIVDFGVAKAANRAVETRTGAVRGTISYLSPEQCRGERVDRRSDLFSLGVVMWEMLTGERLYRRASDFDHMTAIVHEPPPPPSSRRPDVPRAVDAIVLRLLAKSPGERFQTAAELVLALEDVSMRAGTMLSTSAVSRLVRELFGVRGEPWLELEEPALRDSVTLLSQPVPDEPGAPASAGDDVDLARVPDLTAARAARSTTLPPPGAVGAARVGDGAAVGAAVGAAAIDAAPTTLSVATGVASQPPGQPARRTRSRGGIVLGIAALAIAGLAIAGGAAAILATRGSSERPAPAAATAPSGASAAPAAAAAPSTATSSAISAAPAAMPDAAAAAAPATATSSATSAAPTAPPAAAAAPPRADAPDPRPAKPADHRARKRAGEVPLDADGLPISR